MTSPIRLGTRSSPLARWQAEWVAARLRDAGTTVELVMISTRGDHEQAEPIGQISGGQGVFTKELQRALLDGRIDLAVHSLKDLPTDPVAGLCLAAVPLREVCGDVLVSQSGVQFESLPHGALVGTGSLRRQSQLLYHRPDLVMRDIRGNIDTRIEKVQHGEYAAIVLAEAGIKRLGLQAQITQVLPKSLMLPAVGQGALGLETRDEDAPTQAALRTLDHPESHQAVQAERTLLATLRGGCLAPVGAWGRMENGRLKLSGVVLSRDGRHRLFHESDGDPACAADIGREVAEHLLQQGAATLIAQSRQT